MARRAAVDKKGVAAEETTTRETRIVVVVVRLGLGVLRRWLGFRSRRRASDGSNDAIRACSCYSAATRAVEKTR